MYLGIEIGGTKLQLGVSEGGGQLAELVRCDIDPSRGAAGILSQIEAACAQLLKQYEVARIGIGFGGPVDADAGTTIKSHQVTGWDDFPLVSWCTDRLGIDAVLGNDCDAAALAEASLGAGRRKGSVFYVTVGTGIGGGFVIANRLQGAGRLAVAEIGHLRPGIDAEGAEQTVESIACGPAIATWVRKQMTAPKSNEDVKDLLARCTANPSTLDAKIVAEAAADGNRIAIAGLRRACRVLGWAVAQVVTLLAPEIVVIGGGVALIGEDLFLAPVRDATGRFVFPPLSDSFQVVPAALGESVVVHGAIALAASPGVDSRA